MAKSRSFGIVGDPVRHLLVVIKRQFVVFKELSCYIPGVLVEVVRQLQGRLSFFDVDVKYVIIFFAVVSRLLAATSFAGNHCANL